MADPEQGIRPSNQHPSGCALFPTTSTQTQTDHSSRWSTGRQKLGEGKMESGCFGSGRFKEPIQLTEYSETWFLKAIINSYHQYLVIMLFCINYHMD